MKLILVIALTAVIDAQERIRAEMNDILGDNWATEGAIAITREQQCERIDPIPDNLCKLPRFIVYPTYMPATIYPKGMECGKKYKASQFSYPPEIKWNSANENDLYTFLITSCETTLQWGVINIKGSVLLTEPCGYVTGFPELTEYKYKAFDRFGQPVNCNYAFFLYQQKGPIPENAKDNVNSSFFSVKDFAKEHDLCGPVGTVQANVTNT